MGDDDAARDILSDIHDRAAFLPPWRKFKYDADYVRHYEELETGGQARALNMERALFVEKHIGDRSMVDIGSCYGTFIKVRNEMHSHSTLGFDIIPEVREKLKAAYLWHDAERYYSDYASFWDTMEHECVPHRFIGNIRHGLFVSMPIYDNLSDISSNKHFKPGEHVWYFTDEGLLWFMGRQGFIMKDRASFEQDFGRSGILTYFFERK